ncbi:MAG: type II toxin-antitoxin system Phd/YefM family antitoxin [Deltaproteobacteria bacterium]|nr:type II toxin-antitoxin system Phd/YefM family antitoxin [Deltaproteobacteria bacterium]
MDASIIDLRYKTTQILEALKKREKVNVLYHGKIRGVIVPITPTAECKVEEHDFFGMLKKEKKSVKEVMHQLRKGRF